LQILIDAAGKNQGILDTESGRCAAWLRFLKDWSINDIKEYCDKKGWKYQVIQETEKWTEDFIIDYYSD
jgi:hypothetical protein